MYCTFCGAKVSDDDLYCPECGHKLWHADTSENHQARADWVKLVSNFANSSGNRKTAAFERLYTASYGAIYASVQKYAQNPQESEDAVQNAFIICYEKISQLDNATNFIPWMKQIAYNEFLKSVRKTNKEILLTPIKDDEGTETDVFDLTEDDTIPLPEDAYANAELQDLLLDAINSLSEIQRITVKGFYFDQKKISDLASELGIPINSVKTNLSRGRKNLERKVQTYANAYGLKLVPLATIPFLAILAKKDVLAAEATAAGGSALLAAIEKAIGIKVASSISAGVGAATSSTETTVTTGAVSSAASSSAAGSTAASTATVVGTHAVAGSSMAVKIGAGITAVAVAAGGVGVYVHNNHLNTQESAVEMSTVQVTMPEEPAEISALANSASTEINSDPEKLTTEQINNIILQWDNDRWTNDTTWFAYAISSFFSGNLVDSIDVVQNGGEESSYHVSFQYDPQGRVSLETITNNRDDTLAANNYKYTYNNMGLIVSEEHITDSFDETYRYDYQYDDDNRVTYCSYVNAEGGSDTGYALTFSYDDLGRLVSQTSAWAETASRTFSYNDQNELIRTEGHIDYMGAGGENWTNTYNYNQDGTIANISVETMEANGIGSDSTTETTSYEWIFTYDDSRNLIKAESTEDNSEIVTYTYSDTAETNTEEAISSNEMLDAAFSQDVDAVYGGIAEDDLSSSYWIQNMGDDNSPFYIIQTGNYQGSNGIIAELKKDLDGDGQNELLVFYRHKTTQSRYLSNNSTKGAGSFNVWTINMVVYDAENGSVSHSDPLKISTIGNINETNTEALGDAYGLIVYTKETDIGDEILCLSYGTSYLNADGTGETFTAYEYNGIEINEIGSVDFVGSESMGIGGDADFIGKLRTMGLGKSADQIQSTNDLLSENTESHGKVGYYFGIIASDEDNITNEFELYTTSNLNMEAWSSASISGTAGSFDASAYTSTIKSAVYDNVE